MYTCHTFIHVLCFIFELLIKNISNIYIARDLLITLLLTLAISLRFFNF